MIQTKYTLILKLLLVLFALNTLEAAPSVPSKPNVILVFIDDMGWADFSCFGNRAAATPHIDAMASEGIAFEQFYVNSPICSPSRVAISTGTYPQRWRISTYLAGRQFNLDRGQAQWLDPKAPMLARSLSEAGYATGHFGKWHMGGQRDVSDAYPISDYGFDASLTNFEGLGAKLVALTMKPNGEVKPMRAPCNLGGPEIEIQRSVMTSGYIDAAIEFMENAQGEAKPFYVNLWPEDMHSPFWPPLDKWGDGSQRQRYLGALEAMDAQLATLFDYVREHPKLSENTLIIICSDNGPQDGAGRAEPFKGKKFHIYEGGIRSPLIVWGPGIVPKQSVGARNTESVFAAIDLVPSLIRLCGAKKPAGVEYDGEDVLDTLVGKSMKSREQALFFSRPPDTNMKSIYGVENAPDLAVREGKWKLVCDYDGSRPELYAIVSDPAETQNLADQHPELIQALVAKVLDWSGSLPEGVITGAVESLH